MEGFKGRWNSRTVTFLFTYYCILLYVLLFFFNDFLKNENHKTSHGG